MVENISIEKRVSTLHECLIQQAQAHPDRQLFSFLAKGGNVEEVSYGQLHEAALSIGVYLQVNCESGSCILIHCPNDFSFVKAFWGCLYAGMIAVPVQEIQRAATASHFLSIADDAKPTMVLTTPSGRNKLEACLLSQKEPTTLPGPWTITSLDQIPQLSNATVSLQPSTEDIAYLQYTSGSTARPKGVVIKHQNVLANIAAINERGQHGPEDRIVSWLPFFHDMGLVYGVLLPVVLDVPTVILKPLTFLQQPLHWLATISRHQATHTVAPNFAYDLCVQKVDSQNPPTLDLSCLKIASVGAEPVRAETLARFSEAFASAGFDPTVFSPSYGLAENTLMVSVLAMDQNPLHFSVDRNSLGQGIWKEVEPGSANSQILMACGRPSKQTEIVRVHPEKETLCGEDEIGEIWLRSPSAGAGYWQNPAGSKEKFGAYLKEDGRGPYLRTGDLGIIKNDQVIITGRLKDLLIFRGRNYYPNDIESAVQEMDASLRPASCAAFSVHVDGEEQLVLVRVVRRLKRTSEEARQKLVRQIRSCISDHFQLRTHSIALAEPAAFPRTSSGKVQRTACKQKFIEGKWDRAFVYEMRQEMAEMETSAQDAFSDVGKILCTCISSALSIPLKKL
ncbi:MAG: fatty acyl-AMP ligase, partial [Bacteroidota bacterium]